MDTVAQLQALLHDQPHNPLRPAQRQDYDAEAQRLREMVNAPPFVPVNRGKVRQQLQRLEASMGAQVPKPIEESDRKDRVAKLAKQVLEDTIRPAMLTHEEMRRNPAGAVDAFRKRENSRAIKTAILTWKRAQWALEPECPESDYTNLERYRPTMPLTGAATFMANAQIPGVFAMTPQARAQWPLGEPTADTALAQAKRAELDEAIRQADAEAVSTPERVKRLRGTAQRRQAIKSRWAKRAAPAPSVPVPAPEA